MKIFLYNRYWPTSGGGEKHAGGIAEVLSKKHQVTILYCGYADLSSIAAKLNLDLSRVTFISFNDDQEIEYAIKKYVELNRPDIFINATYLSSLITGAPINVSLVFFPKFNLLRKPSRYDSIVYKVGEVLFKDYNNVITFQSGFYHEEIVHYKLGRWSSESSFFSISKPFNKLKIYYNSLDGRRASEVVKSISILGKKVSFNLDSNYINVSYSSLSPCSLQLDSYVSIPCNSNKRSTDARRLGLYITSVDLDTHKVLTKFVLKLWRTKILTKSLSRIYVKWTVVKEYYKYLYFLRRNNNITNSEYTSSWIKRIYGSDNLCIQKLYPPVDVDHFYNTATKENIIICVGRFFVGGHNKKQLELIKAFKKAYDQYPILRSYKLLVCGGTHKETIHQNYLHLCRLAAQGYPIEIFADIPFSVLVEKYSKAKLFWHAAGLYEDEYKTPDRFEHFGITTVEAMASGCVPVVIGIAGQKEIVSHLENGILWSTEQELIKSTLRLVNDQKLLKTLSMNAVIASKEYSRENFNKRVDDIFSDLTCL